MEVKGWTKSGYEPNEELSADGHSVNIGGMSWYPKLDFLELKLPGLHFGQTRRGRLDTETEIFKGKFADLESFVPKKLSRRTISSKFLSVFDIMGKMTPLTAKMKIDLRQAVKETEGWDDYVCDDLRSTWKNNFWMIEKMKGLKFHRAIMPSSAVDTKLRIITCVDAASLLIAGTWGGFKLKEGGYSNQLMIGRGLLPNEDSTIPKRELEALTAGSNLAWIVRSALANWVEDYIVCSDSTIALCWVTAERKRLSLYHRNRTIQIRRGTELSQLYHLETENNPADFGTRPEKVKLSDVGPNSIWELGYDWMREDISEAVSKNILTPANQLRLKPEMEEEFNEGIVFERTPDILTPGHIVNAGNSLQQEIIAMVNIKKEKILERAKFSKYPLSPTKFTFDKVVRIYGYIFMFLQGFKLMKKRLEERRMIKLKFKMFVVQEISQRGYLSVPLTFHYQSTKKITSTPADGSGVGTKFEGTHKIQLSDEFVNDALNYLFRKASDEVQNFNQKDKIMKIGVEKEGVLFSRSRILEGQRFILAGDLKNSNILMEANLNFFTPVVDRFSPLAYSIAMYVHYELMKHAGEETCYRCSLGHCHIIQGMGLFKEINEDCVRCKQMRKKFIEVSMGGISDLQLYIAPLFWVCIGSSWSNQRLCSRF